MMAFICCGSFLTQTLCVVKCSSKTKVCVLLWQNRHINRADGWNEMETLTSALFPQEKKKNGYSLEVLRLCKITDGAPGPEMEKGKCEMFSCSSAIPTEGLCWLDNATNDQTEPWTLFSAERCSQVQAAALCCPLGVPPRLACLSQGLKVPHIASVCQIKPLLSMCFCTILAHRG